MKWRKGDLGRFESEDARMPRFEVIKAVRGEHVEVWYGGSPKTTLIPWDIFFKECTNLWSWEVNVEVPRWLASGQEFVARGFFVQAHLPDDIIVSETGEALAFAANDSRLQIRSVRHDHASCLVLPDGPLIIVSVDDAVKSRRTTAWSRLLNNDIFDEDDDDLSEIFG